MREYNVYTPSLSCTHTHTHTHTHTLAYLNDPSQSEVGHLADQVVSHQDVPGSQVSVDDVSVLQVGHALCDLTAHVDQMS